MSIYQRSCSHCFHASVKEYGLANYYNLAARILCIFWVLDFVVLNVARKTKVSLPNRFREKWPFYLVEDHNCISDFINVIIYSENSHDGNEARSILTSYEIDLYWPWAWKAVGQVPPFETIEASLYCPSRSIDNRTSNAATVSGHYIHNTLTVF
jgi:hypothetical protein